VKKVLFVLKKRSVYSENTYTTVNSGLFNSATFVNNMLVGKGINSKLVQVNDNNDIDREVHTYKPDIVIIEALWVVPGKFEVLTKLHPKVDWVIRLHSELPFLANEGIAMEWLKEYVKYPNVKIGVNSEYMISALEPLLGKEILYMPNYYPSIKVSPSPSGNRKEINIGLFGAIRPMKNSLTQAIAAINYANEQNLVLNLHINTTRLEQKGENILKNVRALFHESKHNLVEHSWLDHKEFLELVSTMDLCLQVSLSETYNIVAADGVTAGVPVVVSEEIPFISSVSVVNNTKDVTEIISKIKSSLRYKSYVTFINKINLNANSSKASKIWTKLIRSW